MTELKITAPNNNKKEETTMASSNTKDINVNKTATTLDNSSAGEARANLFPQFLMKLLNDEVAPASLWWLPDGKAFALDPEKISSQVLDQHFQKTKYSSFIRRLHNEGFRRQTRKYKKVKDLKLPEGAVVLSHDLFQRGNPQLLDFFYKRNTVAPSSAELLLAGSLRGVPGGDSPARLGGKRSPVNSPQDKKMGVATCDSSSPSSNSCGSQGSAYLKSATHDTNTTSSSNRDENAAASELLQLSGQATNRLLPTTALGATKAGIHATMSTTHPSSSQQLQLRTSLLNHQLGGAAASSSASTTNAAASLLLGRRSASPPGLSSSGLRGLPMTRDSSTATASMAKSLETLRAEASLPMQLQQQDRRESWLRQQQIAAAAMAATAAEQLATNQAAASSGLFGTGNSAGGVSSLSSNQIRDLLMQQELRQQQQARWQLPTSAAAASAYSLDPTVASLQRQLQLQQYNSQQSRRSLPETAAASARAPFPGLTTSNAAASRSGPVDAPGRIGNIQQLEQMLLLQRRQRRQQQQQLDDLEALRRANNNNYQNNARR